MSARITREAAREESARASGTRRKTGETTRPRGLDDLQVCSLIEHSREPQMLLDTEGRVVAANAGALQALGLAEDAVIGALLTECGCGVAPHALATLLASETAQILRLFDARGGVLVSQLRPLHDRRGVASAWVLELPEREQDERGALAAVTRLTAELGHDLNNQLAAVLNYAFVIERRLASGHAAGEHLGELRASAWRAAGLTRWLQLGGRRIGQSVAPLSLSDALARLAPLLGQLARETELEVAPVEPGLQVVAALSDVELIAVALMGVGLERATPGSKLSVSVRRAPNGHHVRIACTWGASQVPHRAARSGKPSAHGSLRRALRRVGGRLGHDAQGAWVDLDSHR